MKNRILNLILIILLTSFVQTNIFHGQVVRVVDGDTIVVLNTNNQQVKIRLEGIDCPESNQDFGAKAKKYTSDLCFGKQVRVVESGNDRYGRTLAFVYVNDICVNEELLKAGLAWHYKKYNQAEYLAQLEWNAKKRKLGLWSFNNPIAPWEFRRSN